jgi:hypothetical protein
MLLGGKLLLEGSGIRLVVVVKVSLKLTMHKLGPPLVDPTILFFSCNAGQPHLIMPKAGPGELCAASTLGFSFEDHSREFKNRETFLTLAPPWPLRNGHRAREKVDRADRAAARRGGGDDSVADMTLGPPRVAK